MTKSHAFATTIDNHTEINSLMIRTTSSGIAEAIEISRQGNIVSCPVCGSEVTVLFTNLEELEIQLPLRLFCSSDKKHFYINYDYHFPNDPMLEDIAKYHSELEQQNNIAVDAFNPTKKPELSAQ